jgi:hypothetical protein
MTFLQAASFYIFRRLLPEGPPLGDLAGAELDYGLSRFSAALAGFVLLYNLLCSQPEMYQASLIDWRVRTEASQDACIRSYAAVAQRVLAVGNTLPEV